MKIVLASTSPYRREQLQKLGFEFSAHPPRYDEAPLKEQGLPPLALSAALALGKAQSLAHQFPNDLIIGSDQVAHLEQQTLSKPGTRERACEQLKMMAGKTHTLSTSVAILGPQGAPIVFSNQTHLTMRSLTDSEIESYVQLDNPLDCAGSYKIESYGISLFEAIDTSDFTAIIGLPLLELGKHLRALLHS